MNETTRDHLDFELMKLRIEIEDKRAEIRRLLTEMKE